MKITTYKAPSLIRVRRLTRLRQWWWRKRNPNIAHLVDWANSDLNRRLIVGERYEQEVEATFTRKR